MPFPLGLIQPQQYVGLLAPMFCLLLLKPWKLRVNLLDTGPLLENEAQLSPLTIQLIVCLFFIFPIFFLSYTLYF